MRSIFEPDPPGWVVNKIHSDYGIDFDVQIFDQHKATGEWFKAQLKSSESSAYSAEGDFISETLDLRHAKHYSTQMRDPIFLIHADVATKRTFWHAPQLEAPVCSNDPRATITIRIDTRNELPAKLPELLAALRQVQITLGARSVSESNFSDFAKVVEHNDQAELIRKFQDKIDYVKLQQIHELATKEGMLAEAKERITKLIQNGDSSIESRFSAVFEEERIELLAAHKSGAPQSTTSGIRLRISQRLQQLTKKGPPALKFFALIARKSAELDVLTFQDFGLHMNWLGHVRGGDPAIALQLAAQRLASTHNIVKKYNQCLRLARFASNSIHRWALPNALLRTAQSIAVFILRLKTEGQSAAAESYSRSAMQLCHLAVWIAEHNHDDDALSSAVSTVLLFVGKGNQNIESDDAVKFARATLGKIKDWQYIEVAQHVLERGLRRLAGEKVEGDTEPDLVKQIIENRATGLGIDMTNPDDPAAQLVRLGILDANPERALRHCQRSFVSISGAPPLVYMLSEMLQLPSMLGKRMHCDMHNYSVAGPTLDAACGIFKRKYCDTCNDVVPRPSDWKYSDEWQQQENERHTEFMAEFYRSRQRKTSVRAGK
jgi:uncharacterized protein DUF4365